MPNNTLLLPIDLISAKEAAIMADKSKATIRSWVRRGKITGYKKNPKNHSSPLMVSVGELKLYLNTSATLTHPNNTGRPETPAVSLQEKNRKIEELKSNLVVKSKNEENLQQRLEDLRLFTQILKEQLEQKDKTISNLQERLDLASVQQTKSQEELKNILLWASLPWWKKWRSGKFLNG